MSTNATNYPLLPVGRQRTGSPPGTEFDWESPYTDSSSTLFSLYLSHAEKHDKDQAEGWKVGADGILVFTGLFAAALATFVIDSYKSLLPDSAGNTVILLAQISRQLDGLATNGSAGGPVGAARTHASIINAALGEDWQPPASAVLVNVLWFLSLVISLFCALLATLQQRWARRYLSLTQPHVAIHKRAVIRSFFAEGVARFHASIAVETIPALIHVSVFLFLAGLVVSLFTIHHTVAYVVLASTAVCALVYMAITVLPVVYHDCPYTSPFSALVWYIFRKVPMALLIGFGRVADYWEMLNSETDNPPDVEIDRPDTRKMPRDMTKDAHEAAMQSKGNKKMLARALGWTLDKMDEESELVEFAAGIPGFHSSIEVKEAVSILEEVPSKSKYHPMLWQHILSLLIQAKRPGLMADCKVLPDTVREHRIKVCLDAIYHFPPTLKELLYHAVIQIKGMWFHAAFDPMLRSMESWRVAEKLSVSTPRIHQDVMIGAQCMAAVNASCYLRYVNDQEGEPILKKQLNISDADWQRYREGPVDNLLLKNVNNFLEKTALPSIEFAQDKFAIMIPTACLIVEGLDAELADLELRVYFEGLRTQIRGHAEGRWYESKNVQNLLVELRQIPPPAPNGTDTTATPMPVHPHPPQMPSPPSISQHSDDAYAAVLTSSPPLYDTHPLLPTPTPDRSL